MRFRRILIVLMVLHLCVGMGATRVVAAQISAGQRTQRSAPVKKGYPIALKYRHQIYQQINLPPQQATGTLACSPIAAQASASFHAEEPTSPALDLLSA